MKYNALQSHIQSKKFRPCYIVMGEDKWLVNSAVDMLCSVANNPLINAVIYNQNEDEENIVNALKVMPWDSDYRVVVALDFSVSKTSSNGQKNTGKKILEYLEEPNPSSILVISGEESFLAKLSKKAEVIDCSKLENTELVQFIKKQCNDNIEKAAIDTLIAYCSKDMGRINTELQKILSYKIDQKITEQDVKDIAIKDDEYKIYELTNCLANKQPDEAFRIWNTLSYASDDVYLINAVYAYFRKLLYVAVNKNQNDLYKQLGVNEYAFKYLLNNSKSFGAVKLKKICDELQSMEFRIKSGKLDKVAAADAVILNIINI
ncbi:MAG TPA: DNA polymerase III subunit delta [Clostridia bacterium]